LYFVQFQILSVYDAYTTVTRKLSVSLCVLRAASDYFKLIFSSDSFTIIAAGNKMKTK
jgi:hypothetical protein